MSYRSKVKALENAISQNDGEAKVSIDEFLVLEFKDGSKFYFEDNEGGIPIIRYEEPKP